MNQILPFIAWKRGKYYLKVNKDFTSQECSNCGQFTGKKKLSERIHDCQYCGHKESRDTNAAKVIKNRGLMAVGHTVKEKACGDRGAGIKQLTLFDLVTGQ